MIPLVGFLRSIVACGVKKEHKDGDIECFGDDLLINILTRLPPESAFACRRVSRRCHASICPLQLRDGNAFFFSLGRISDTGVPEAFIIHADPRKVHAEQTCKSLMSLFALSKIPCPFIHSTCDGFVLCISIFSQNAVICNPITRRALSFSVEKSPEGGCTCGFFRHPREREYMVLYKYLDSRRGSGCYFRFFRLRTRSWTELDAHYDFEGTAGRIPTIANGCLNWMAAYRDIDPHCPWVVLKFDMISQQVQLMPHPGCQHCPWPHHRRALPTSQMTLSEMNGQLYFCHLLPSGVLRICVLADPATWGWLEMHRMDFPPFYPDPLFLIIGFHYGDLFMYSCDCLKLYAYNFYPAKISRVDHLARCGIPFVPDKRSIFPIPL